MSIRLKTLLLTSLIFFGFFLLQYFILGNILLGEYYHLEEAGVRRNTGRVLEALNAEINALNLKTPDWAQWDDAYQFIGDRNPAFIKSNLQYTSLQSLGIQAMVFINESGQIVYTLGYDSNTREAATPSATLLSNLTAGSFLLRFSNTTDSRSGIIVLPEGPMMVSLRPIVKTDLTGPIRGTILFGKYIDPAEVDLLATRTQTQVAIAPFPSQSMTPDFRSAAERITDASPVYVKAADAARISGYAIVRDLFGKPGIMVKDTVSRDIVIEGKRTVNISLLSIVITGVLFILLAFYILDSILTGRLVVLQKEVRGAAASGLLNTRITELSGNDELSTLSRDINAMLTAIEEKQYMLEGERIKSLRYLDAVPFLVVILGADQTVKYANVRAIETLGFEHHDIIGKNWFDQFVPQDIRERIRYDFVRMMTGQTDRLEQYRYPIVTKTGDYVMLDWHNTILRSPEGMSTDAVCLGEPARI